MSLEVGSPVPGPHGGARIATVGPRPAEARAAGVLCHGRGGTAQDMLQLAETLDVPGVCWVAPQAARGTWYPNSFLAPLKDNEPHLTSALALLARIVETLGDQGPAPQRLLLLGFSQGGCLTLEFAGRFAARFGGVAGLSAGLIGPPGRAWAFPGTLEGTPVFLGCSDDDPHIPLMRVRESARELERIGGKVEVAIYPGLGHTVNQDELDRIRTMIGQISS